MTVERLDAPARADLARRIFECAHVTGRFRLRSGVTTDVYFDKYKFESDPRLLHDIASALRELVPETEIDAFAGIELGGVPLATMLSHITGIPAFFVRKEPKEYGMERLAEGGDVSGRKLVVIEDVITSGGQIVITCKALRSLGAEVVGVASVIDRESGGLDNLRDRGIEARALFTISELKRAGAAQT